jgi:drug/metabolite transporter (DMT)-like permease
MSGVSNLRGIIYMLLSVLAFVGCDSFLKLLLLHVPPYQTLVLRGAAATLWCFGLIALMGQLKHLPKAFDRWVMLRSFMEVLSVSAYIVALAHVPFGDITAIYQTAPLLVIAGASLIWGEKVGLARWLLIAFGLTGALVVAQPGGESTSPYALLGLITAAGVACRDMLSRKAKSDVPGIIATFNVIVMVPVCALITNQLFGEWVAVSKWDVVYAFGSGFFVVLGHFFVFMSFRHATARAVAPFYYVSIIAAALAGALFFAEIPNNLALVGFAMIIACGLGVLYFERRENPT